MAKTTMTPAEIVEGIQNNRPEAHEALYSMLQRSPRFFLWKETGVESTDDYLHDIYIIVVEAIRAGDIRIPDALRLFVRTITKRKVAQHIDSAIRSRHQDAEFSDGLTVSCECPLSNPERTAIVNERNAIIEDSLSFLNGRDQEIIRDFYGSGFNRKEICERLSISETQFRVRKTRALAVVAQKSQNSIARGKRHKLLQVAQAA